LAEDALLAIPWSRDIAVATPGPSVIELDRGTRCCDSDISGPQYRQKRIFGQDISLYELLDLVNSKYGKGSKFDHVKFASLTGMGRSKKKKKKNEKNEKLAIQAHDVARCPSFGRVTTSLD
jgi:hypothetical protein